MYLSPNILMAAKHKRLRTAAVDSGLSANPGANGWGLSRASWQTYRGQAAHGCLGHKTAPAKIWQANSEVQPRGAMIGGIMFSNRIWMPACSYGLLLVPPSNVQALQMDCTAPSLHFPEAACVNMAITNQVFEGATTEHNI